MSGRLIEIIVPDTRARAAEDILPRHCRRFWKDELSKGRVQYTCIVQKRYTERFLKEMSSEFSNTADFSILVMRLEAVEPRIWESADTRLPMSDEIRPPTKLEQFFTRDRLSTDELYDDIADSLSVTPAYLATVILSVIIAALGMRSGQTAVVIGAMVIAPLLGPTIGLALATTLGERDLGRQAASTLAAGTLLAFLCAVGLGRLIDFDPATPELFNRTIVHPADVALALASGAAGVLAFSQGASLSLVGVMIAVALVPPLSAAGLYASHGIADLSGRALFLFATNVVCINVAGIATFLIQGLPPKRWRITTGIMLTWVAILGLFLLAMAGRTALTAS